MPTPAFYDRKSHNFWMHTDLHGWTSVSRESLKMRLQEGGMSGSAGTSQKCPELSKADDEINRIIRMDQVDLACNVAGWEAGVYKMYGKRVLVQESPQLLQPTQGSFPFIEAALRAYSKVHPIQLEVLKAWLHLGMIKVYRRQFRYSQMLIIVGGAGAGKSLFQLIVTTLCGNLEADPMQWMLGHTAFSKDLFEAIHLCSAEPSCVTVKDRQLYYNSIKELSVKEGRRCRGLYSEAVTLSPFQICTTTLNPERQNLELVPEPVPGIADKFHAVLFPAGSFPLEGFPLMEMHEVKALVQKEASAFLWHLLNEYQVPETLKTLVKGGSLECHRYGMDYYHNPEIMEMVLERSDEARILSLFERLAIKTGQPIWQGSAVTLAERLQEHSSDFDTKRLTSDTRKLGYILRSLHRSFPEKVQQLPGKTKDGVVWVVIAQRSGES